MSPVELVLSKLEKVRPRGRNRWSACCPAHDDQRPSLSVREAEDGKALIYCFAGCKTVDVVQAIGLSMADLFVPGDNAPHHRSTPPWRAARNGGETGPSAPFRRGAPRHSTSLSRHSDSSDDATDPLFGLTTTEALEILAHSCTGAYVLLSRVADGETLNAQELDYLGDIVRRVLVLRHFFDQHPLD